MLIKERLKYARERLGLSQTELAQRSGVALRVIVKREGQSGGVTSDTLVSLANVLEVSTDWLTGRVGQDELHGHAQRVLSESENEILVALRDFDLGTAKQVVRRIFADRALGMVNEAFPEDDTPDVK